MKKIALVSALTMLFAHNAKAADDIDCVKYTAEEAKAATSDSNDNTFGAVFSHASARRGNTNKDCKKKEEISNNNNTSVVVDVEEPELTHGGGSN